MPLISLRADAFRDNCEPVVLVLTPRSAVHGWASLVMILLLAGLLMVLPTVAQAESLFRANATYTADMPMSPRSLFTTPMPRYVGDSVTIAIDEFTQQNLQMDFKTEKSNTIDENGSQILNAVTGSILNRLPIGGLQGTASKLLNIPSISGLDNSQQQNTKANVIRQNRIRDNVTCQVMQVLPNGNLVVQGRKVTMMAKERSDLFVSGIVNPFYLDAQNQIPSAKVANLQFLLGGQGAISRQQNDGILTKLYQWLQ